MKIFDFYPSCFLLLVICAIPLSVSAEIKLDDDFSSIFDYKEGASWKEEALKIPPLPEESGLLPIEVDRPGFKHFIDEKSLSVGSSDRVIRYTVVVESPGGTRNTLYEALNCHAIQFKTYAYSINGQAFLVMKDPKWKNITPLTTQNFRAELYRIYFCINGADIKNKKEIIQRIKYPPNNDQDNQ